MILGVLHFEIIVGAGRRDSGIELPCLNQTLLLICICMYKKIQLTGGKRGRVESMLLKDAGGSVGGRNYVGGVMVMLADTVGDRRLRFHLNRGHRHLLFKQGCQFVLEFAIAFGGREAALEIAGSGHCREGESRDKC